MSGPQTIRTVNVGDLRRARERLSRAHEKLVEAETALRLAEEEHHEASIALDDLEGE